MRVRGRCKAEKPSEIPTPTPQPPPPPPTPTILAIVVPRVQQVGHPYMRTAGVQRKMNGGDSSRFQFSKAIVCGVPKSLPVAAQRQNDSSEPVELSKALKQHAEYVRALKILGLQVTELPAAEEYPDCVFVEDVAVVCDGIALVPRLGHPSRRGESVRMKEVLQGLGLSVVDMEEPAALDGGDVLFTGKEFLVGLSKRTNQQGLDSLAKAFPSYPVTGIPVTGQLHLKSMMTMAGPHLIAVGGSSDSATAWNEIEKKAKFQYERFMVPDDRAANCLFANDTLFHLTEAEIPNSYGEFKQLPGAKVELENSELYKVDGCLTCLSILIWATGHFYTRDAVSVW